MSRFTFYVLCLVAIVIVGGVVMLGAFPPHPHTEQVERVLPNDRFAPQH